MDGKKNIARMSESSKNIPIQQSSPKSFGIVFSIVFLIVSLYPLTNSEELRVWAIIISVIFAILAYLAPNTLILPNKFWFKFGIFVGSIIAPIVMAFVYFSTVLPTGLIMRLLGKDILKQNLDKNVKSYWIDRKDPEGSMKNQF
jgi:ABC-type Fe3+ transport system permease subunit